MHTFLHSNKIELMLSLKDWRHLILEKAVKKNFQFSRNNQI